MTPVLIAVICLLTAAFVLLPLRLRASNPSIEYSNGVRDVSQRELLIEKRDGLLRQMKELEFDRSMDKVNAEDYERLRGELSQQTSLVLEQMERGENVPVVAPDFDVETEILIARARRKRAAQNPLSGATWTCACGRTMSENDKFCASCGAPRPTSAIVE